MPVLVPTSIDDAMAAISTPGAEILAGGTDFMVEVNAGVRRPDVVVALHRLAEIRGWSREGGEVRLGSGLTYTEMLDPGLATLLPALAQAARTVGSPPIRNAGTLGGNLGTASPAGDTLPVLVALNAVVEVVGPEGSRNVPFADFVTGPKRNGLRPGELIVAVRVALVDGHQEYRKVGTRNAMVIAVASVALVVDEPARSIRCGLGSVGPTPLRAPEAEAWLSEQVDWAGHRAGRPVDQAVLLQFGTMVAAAARPIDDHRSTAAYRRHAVGVLARRAAAQTFAPGAAA